MAYTAKPDGAWIDKTALGGTATSNLIDAVDCNRWESNQLDAHTRLTAVEATVHAVGNSGTALTLNPTVTGYVKTITLTGNCTFTLTGATSGTAITLELILTQDATGGRTVTWPAAVKWSGGAPVLSSTASAVDRVVLTTYNGGTTWYGDLVGTGYV